MKTFAALYGIATGLFVVIDAIWLTLIANKFYKEKLGSLLADKPSLAPAVIFYAIYILALIVFVIKPGLDSSLSTVAWRAALLGFAMYATYDLTNQATLKNWPHSITVIDLLWGTFITTVVCVSTVFIYTRFIN